MLDGARDIVPMIVSLVPFAVAIGAAVASSNLSRLDGLLSGPAMLAGSAQLATVEMLDAGTAPLVIVTSALIINARLVLYGASLGPWFSGWPLWKRFVLAVPVIDQLYFTCIPRFERGDLDLRHRTSYYLGAAVALAGSWTLVQALTIIVGANAPDALGLDLAAPLALIGLVAKSVMDRPSTTAAGVGLVVAVVAVGLPMHTSLLTATILGMAAGVISTRPEDES